MRGVALIYVRRSMVRYDKHRASPERQLANCVAVREEKSWAYEVYEHAEGHRPGRCEKHRPRCQRLKAQLSPPGTAAVVPQPWFWVLSQDLAEAWCVERAWRGPGADSVPRLATLMP